MACIRAQRQLGSLSRPVSYSCTEQCRPRTHPGVVVEGVWGEGIVHQSIAAAGAAAKDDLNGARDVVLGIGQQRALQFRHHLLRTCTSWALHLARRLQMNLDYLEAGTCDNPSPCLACALAEALAPIRTHVPGKGPGLLQGHDCASASRVLLIWRVSGRGQAHLVTKLLEMPHP